MRLASTCLRHEHVETSTNVGTNREGLTANHIFCAHVHDQALMAFSGTACPLCSYEYQFVCASGWAVLVCFVLSCSLAVRLSILGDDRQRKQILKAKKQWKQSTAHHCFAFCLCFLCFQLPLCCLSSLRPNTWGSIGGRFLGRCTSCYFPGFSICAKPRRYIKVLSHPVLPF